MAATNRTRRRVGLGCAGALAVFGLVANLALAAWSASVREGGDRLTRFLRAQIAVADVVPGAQPPRVLMGARPPDQSRPDTVFVVDDCAAGYFGTGDLYEPWVPMWDTTIRVELAVDELNPRLGASTTPLVEFNDGDGYRVDLEIAVGGHYRLVAVGASGGFDVGEWAALDDLLIRVDVIRRPDWHEFLVDAPGQLYTGVPARALVGDDLRARPRAVRVVDDLHERLDGTGITATVVTEPPSLCRELLEHAPTGDP